MQDIQAGRRPITKLTAIPLSKVFCLIEPRPVVLLTTAEKGRANIMTRSWHMMMEFEPPLIGCVVSPANYSFAALRKTRECVIAIPAADLISKVVDIGNCLGNLLMVIRLFCSEAV